MLYREEVVAFRHNGPTRRLGRRREWCMMRRITWGEHWSHYATNVLGCGIGEALPNGMGRGLLRKEPVSMRATQFVRRGLIAFAAVATLSVGFSGAVGAQSPGAVIDLGDPIVFEPVPGYSYDVVHAAGARSALLGVSTGAGTFPVVVQFLPDFTGAAIVNPVEGNLIAADAAEYAAALAAELAG